jgi:hypothetical protein
VALVGWLVRNGRNGSSNDIWSEGNGLGYTIGQAAKATGKSKSTIFRAIKSGRISASRDENGDFDIDPSELHRVFPKVWENVLGNASAERISVPPEREIELLREQLAREREFNRDLARRLDESEAERRKLTVMLLASPERSAERPGPPPPTPDGPPAVSLVEKLFGKRQSWRALPCGGHHSTKTGVRPYCLRSREESGYIRKGFLFWMGKRRRFAAQCLIM